MRNLRVRTAGNVFARPILHAHLPANNREIRAFCDPHACNATGRAGARRHASLLELHRLSLLKRPETAGFSVFFRAARAIRTCCKLPAGSSLIRRSEGFRCSRCRLKDVHKHVTGCRIMRTRHAGESANPLDSRRVSGPLPPVDNLFIQFSLFSLSGCLAADTMGRVLSGGRTGFAGVILARCDGKSRPVLEIEL